MEKNLKENKPYTITFEHRNGYLYAYGYAKRDSFDISLEFWTEVAAYCKDNKCSKVLVEEDFETDTSINDKYELMSHMHKMGFTGITVAFIDRHPEQMTSNLFGETVALNQGFIAKVFSNVKEAEEWLLS